MGAPLHNIGTEQYCWSVFNGILHFVSYYSCGVEFFLHAFSVHFWDRKILEDLKSRRGAERQRWICACEPLVFWIFNRMRESCSSFFPGWAFPANWRNELQMGASVFSQFGTPSKDGWVLCRPFCTIEGLIMGQIGQRKGQMGGFNYIYLGILPLTFFLFERDNVHVDVKTYTEKNASAAKSSFFCVW